MMTLRDILKADLLAKFGPDRPLTICETGTIRGDRVEEREGDGWSTIFFAERVKRLHMTDSRAVVSIDIAVEAADKVLTEQGLRDWVELRQGYSVDHLAFALSKGQRYDVILLDSDNDAELILHEFMIAQYLINAGGTIFIDDVRLTHHADDARKGLLVWPWILDHRLPHRVYERGGWNGYRTGVLAVDMP